MKKRLILFNGKFPLSAVLALVGILVMVSLSFFISTKLAYYWDGGLILGFGIWRAITEKDRYQRFRILFIVSSVLLVWYALPLFELMIPRFAGTEDRRFPAIHRLGTLTFFLFFIPVLLFGRGADCGWFCPCVALRETVGYPFRRATRTGKFWWRLRLLKWPTAALGIALLILGFVDPPLFRQFDPIYHVPVFSAYVGSYLLLPLLGHRSFCRFGCPFAAMWGLVGKLGFYKIKAQQNRCQGCKTCESVCHMGVPLSQLIRKSPTIKTVECVGCGRCASNCPNGVLQLHDIRGKRAIPTRYHPIAKP